MFLQSLSGSKLQYNMEQTDSIMAIKSLLEEKEGINVKMIRLIHAGKQLADETTIEDNKIEAGTVIHMVLQLRWTIHQIFLVMILLHIYSDKQDLTCSN